MDVSEDELEHMLDGDDDVTGGGFEDLSGDEAVEDNSYNHEEGVPSGSLTPPQQKPIKIKKPVLNPQPKLNLESLQGPKGLTALNDLFQDFKFRGSGHEKEDISDILKKLEQWTFRLFPKFHFEDSLKRMEALGKKREVQVYLRKIRSGALDNDVICQDDDGEDDFPDPAPIEDAPDAFDTLLSQQIQAMTPARGTPLGAPLGTPHSAPLGTPQMTLTPEQLARIERNKQMALEKRKQRLAEEARVAEEAKVADVMGVDTGLMEVDVPVAGTE